MVSAFGLRTVANVEGLMGGIVFDSVDASYTDAIVETSIINPSEREVIGLSNHVWTAAEIASVTDPLSIAGAAALDHFIIYKAEKMMVADKHMEESDRTISKSDIKMDQENIKTLLQTTRNSTVPNAGFYVIKGSGI